MAPNKGEGPTGWPCRRPLPEASAKLLSRNVGPSPLPHPPSRSASPGRGSGRATGMWQLGQARTLLGHGRWGLRPGVGSRSRRPSWLQATRRGVWKSGSGRPPAPVCLERRAPGTPVCSVKAGLAGHPQAVVSLRQLHLDISYPPEATRWLKGQDQTTDGTWASSQSCVGRAAGDPGRGGCSAPGPGAATPRTQNRPR